MSLKAYEDACLRAELFGQPKPDREEFLEKHKYLDVNEFEDVDIKISENTAILNDATSEANDGLGDFNTLLATTHSKLNRLKGVCGTVTNYFRVKMSTKDLSYSSEPSYVGQTNFDKDFVAGTSSDFSTVNTGLGPRDNEMSMSAGKRQHGGDINTAIEDLKTMQKAENSFSFGGLLQ
ncbi:uncharacterized protein LOC126967398 [Leptidea sinapis]|uniref:uncharacterized protein LOC126967398 n=1 Tax=Leptidea sinapis TaxID=189913 RepID=UPI00213182A4|nr:uncharacterized protein LOC126967398 [Leptidea sinapis]